MAKRAIALISSAMIFLLLAVPALAQEGGPSQTATDQYGPGGELEAVAEAAAIQAIEDLIGQDGADVDGAEAYAAALNAAQDTGVDTETAEVVAARAVAATEEPETPETRDEPEKPGETPGTSEEPEKPGETPGTSEEPEITELPDTGGAPLLPVAGAVLVGAGLLVHGVRR